MNNTLKTTMTKEEAMAMKEKARIEDPELYNIFLALEQMDKDQLNSFINHLELRLRCFERKPSRNFDKLKETGHKVSHASGRIDIFYSDLVYMCEGTDSLEEACYEGFICGLGLGAQIQKRKGVL